MSIDINAVMDELGPDIKGQEEVYLSIYTVHQCYGGPEEGGWYYNRHSFEGAKLYQDIALAEAGAEKLMDWIAKENEQLRQQVNEHISNMPDGPDPYLDTEGYIPIGFSVDDNMQIVFEKQPGHICRKEEEEGRPHYE